ncbi:MAG: hypothetical protein LC676_10975 [Loktanella sp.]|nr:hypothetical protein [Loktanella sp.]
MDQKQRTNREIERQFAALDGAALISPAALSARVFNAIASGDENPDVQYNCEQNIRQMCRGFLRRKHDPDDELSDTDSPQEEFTFADLQKYYPLPPVKGEDRRYKLRELLTPEEREWNINMLLKNSETLQKHADALRREGEEIASRLTA